MSDYSGASVDFRASSLPHIRRGPGSLTFLHVYDSRFIAAVDARAFRGLKGRYCAFGVGGFPFSLLPWVDS